MYNQCIKYFLSLPAGFIEKAHTEFEKVLEVKVTIKRKKSVILGFAGSGKTHTLALLLHNKPPSKRVSTPCFKSPVRSIAFRRFKRCPSSESCTEISREVFFQRIMRSGKDALSQMSPSSTEKKIVQPVELTINKRKDLVQNKLSRRVKVNLLRDSILAKRVEPLIDEVVAEITDSGGQPQFLEILPRFISGINVAIVVTNLSERLDECPTSYLYGEDGVQVGEGEPSKITNEQMLHHFMQMVVSQCRGSSQIKIVIVGTHRDLEHKCKEKREEKERKLSNMVRSFDLGDDVVYADHKGEKLIFAVNAKDPNEADYEMGRKVMEVMMDEDGIETITIPLKFHLLEETLREMSTTGQIALTVNEVMQNVKEYFTNEKSLKEGLKYLEQSNRIFYFSELFPDKVFGEPQAVLNMVTEIVKEHIQLTTGVNTGRVIDGVWKKFKEQGIITENILKKMSNGYSSHFTPMDMLKLLEELLIVFKRIPGEFLMPCLLSVETSKNMFESPTADSMLHIPMMLHFRKGTARIGIFCSTVCMLISSKKWNHYEQSNVARNSFSFTRPLCLGVVCLQDFYDSFFQVTLHFPSDPELYHKLLPSTCVALRDTVKEAINVVTKALHYVPDEPVLAFECVVQHKSRYSLHAAEYIKGEVDYLICTREPSIHVKVTDHNKLWQGVCTCRRCGQ